MVKDKYRDLKIIYTTKGGNVKNFLKKLLIWTLIFTMVLSTPVEIFAQVTRENVTYNPPKISNYEDLSQDKSKIINELKPVKPAKLKSGQKAEDLIKNPEQPKIYTLRTDYKVQRGEKYEVGYQPYIASVGEAASEEEKAKVNKVITLPELAGYDKSHLEDTFTNNYDEIVKAAKNGTQSGNKNNGIRYEEERDFKYKSKSNTITIKHVFQDLHDFSKYTNPDGTITHSDGTKGTLINKGGTNR